MRGRIGQNPVFWISASWIMDLILVRDFSYQYTDCNIEYFSGI